ncbi:MAG: alpha-glucosidase/alpha-galactosidase [Clostridiales bacterium]|nr:alpha-glucosidase/alpha-galactosidase [Clostridiales bacterium]
MIKVTFMGAGSTVFARNVLGDCMCTPVLRGLDIALYDIDPVRLEESQKMLDAINRNCQANAIIRSYLGVENRREALRGADFVVNAIQVGLYDPCTIIDFEVPKKFGLRQTIADTLGIGGIFRALRTIPVMLDFAEDMKAVCPNAWFLNYTNPMAMLTGAMLRETDIKTVGLCHSVQVCAESLFKSVGMENDPDIQTKIAGINHMAWLLEITKDGKDLYPEIKARAAALTEKHDNMVRLEIMKRFGYYVTESSEHNAEYMPFFIKDKYPELIERFNIPLDEYPRRCIKQIEDWKTRSKTLTDDPNLSHERTHEYASYIIEAMVTGKPYKIGGNVLNNGLITNLPRNAIVEVPCLVDRSGVNPTYIGDLPEQLAALNRTNINVQLLTLEAARTRRKDYIYQAAMMDPHLQSELSIDDIVALCDALIQAHAGWLPEYH